MPDLQQTMTALSAKKKFSKGARPDTYKPSVVETTDQPIDKPTNPGLTSKSDHVEPTLPPISTTAPLSTQAPAHTDLAHSDPAPVEPSQTEMAQSEMAHNETALSETAQADPAHKDPAHADLDHSDPDTSDLAHTDPAQTDPALSDPDHSDLALSDPAHSELGQTEMARSDLAHYDPARTDPTHTDPAQTDPTEDESHENLKGFLPVSKRQAYHYLQILDPYEFKIFMFCCVQGLNRSEKHRRKVGGDGKLFAGIGFISKGTKMPPATVKRHLKSLIDRKLMKLVKKTTGGSNLYSIVKDLEWKSDQLDPAHNDPAQSDSSTRITVTQGVGSERSTNKEVLRRSKKGDSPSAVTLIGDLVLQKWDENHVAHAGKDGKFQGLIAQLIDRWGSDQARSIVLAAFKDKKLRGQGFPLNYIVADAHRLANPDGGKRERPSMSVER